MVTVEWICRNSYVIFRDRIVGSKEIPIEGEGHCPTLKLNTDGLSYRQFKYLISNLKKEIKEKGFDSFNLSPCFHFKIDEPIIKEVYAEYCRIDDICDHAVFVKKR